MIRRIAANIYRRVRHFARVTFGQMRLAVLGRRLRAGPGDWVILLSLGRQGPSQNVAREAAGQGFRICVLCPEFPAREAPFMHDWRRVPGLNDISTVQGVDDLVRDLRALAPVAVLLEGKNLLLPAQTRLARALGLRAVGERPALASNSKIAMRQALDTVDGPKLAWQEVTDVHAPVTLALPAIYKPDMGTASKGVRLIASPEDLRRGDAHDAMIAADISVGDRRLLEGFIQGRQFDMEGIARDGNYLLLACVEEHYAGRPPYFPPAWHYFNPPLDTAYAAQLEDAMQRALSALGVTDGAFHMEMRVDAVGHVYPIDYANRMGYNQLVSTASGVSFPAAYVGVMTGRLEFGDVAFDRRAILNVFCQEARDLERAHAFRRRFPDNVLRFSPAPGRIGYTDIHGRITIIDTGHDAIVAKLAETDMLPPQFATFYAPHSG